MERHFELELEKLNKRLIKMGNLVSEQVHNAFDALLRGSCCNNCPEKRRRERVQGYY